MPELNLDELSVFAKGKTFLVTGGTGSFGKTIVKDLLNRRAGAVRVMSRDENKQEELRLELNTDKLELVIGDVRDKASVMASCAGVDYVFHAAALKQVPSCEFFPIEAVKTNILGSQNVIEACVDNEVKALVCLSTDKAVLPLNAMGMTKGLMEKLVLATARRAVKNTTTTISVVRYGNVLMSRGSVVPLFVKQIKQNQPITITNASMSRFLMPLSHSIDLVYYAMQNATTGDLFVRKVPSTTMGVLADAVRILCERPNHPIVTIGSRHGEKLFETLLSHTEIENMEDHGHYIRVPMDDRTLNYKKFMDEGSETLSEQVDINSHNQQFLSVEETASLLKGVPGFMELISS